MASLRIMILCHDDQGISHTVRALNLAGQLANRIRGCSLLLITDLPLIGKLQLPPNVDYIHLPSVHETAEGKLQAPHLPIKVKRALRLRSKVVQAAAKAYKPHLLLIDRDPTAITTEIPRMLGFIRKIRPKCRFVWMLPDVVGEPELVRQQWLRCQTYDLLQEWCNEVWICGSQDLFDACEGYQFPNTLRAITHFAGYLPAPQGNTNTASSPVLSDGGARFIVVNCGSGRQCLPLLRTYLMTIQNHLLHEPVHSVIISGPLVRGRQKRRLRDRVALAPDSRFYRFTRKVHVFERHADLIISTGGYNVVCEAMTFGKKTLIVPDEDPAGEHRLRASLMSRLGMACLARQQALQPAGLAEAINTMLEANDSVEATQMNRYLVGLEYILNRIDKIYSWQDAA